MRLSFYRSIFRVSGRALQSSNCGARRFFVDFLKVSPQILLRSLVSSMRYR